MRPVFVEVTSDGVLLKDSEDGELILSFDLREAWALQDFLKAASIIYIHQKDDLNLRIELDANKNGIWFPQ